MATGGFSVPPQARTRGITLATVGVVATVAVAVGVTVGVVVVVVVVVVEVVADVVWVSISVDS